MKWWYCLTLFFAGLGLGLMLCVFRKPPPGPPLSPEDQEYAKAVKWYGGEV